MNWLEMQPGKFQWEPAPGKVYTCTRVSNHYKGTRHFARLNGTTLGTTQQPMFMGSLDKCKELCEKHHQMNSMGGEAP